MSDAGTLQTVTIVLRYIKEHPKRWNMHSVHLVEEALVKVFPCPRRFQTDPLPLYR
jgi:hypothetical protein